MLSSSPTQEHPNEPGGAMIASRSLTDNAPSAVLLDALSETDIDLAETDQRLNDQIDTDALDRLFSKPDESVRFSAVIWGYPVVVTSDVVRVFETTSDSDISV